MLKVGGAFESGRDLLPPYKRSGPSRSDLVKPMDSKDCRTSHMKIMMLLGAILLLALGCGIKADPVPWETIVPKRIVDLRAVSREGRVVLEWTAPKENTDRTVLTDLVEFQVLRSEGDLVGEECTGCGGKPTVVNQMKLEGYDDPRGKKMSMV
jgi:hypothetical protein